jgi:hypothetical protein
LPTTMAAGIGRVGSTRALLQAPGTAESRFGCDTNRRIAMRSQFHARHFGRTQHFPAYFTGSEPRSLQSMASTARSRVRPETPASPPFPAGLC